MIYKTDTSKSFCIYEAQRGLKRNKIVYIAIAFQCIICLTLISISYNNFNKGDNSLKNINAYYNKIHYSLHDIADKDGSFVKYEKSEKEYYNLKRFVEELRNNKNIDFFNTILQPINIYEHDIPNKFFYQYEEGDESLAELEEINGRIVKSSWVKSIQMSKNLKDIFNLKMESGNFFCDDDFILDERLYYNAILGYEYKDYFNIGDTLKVDYLFEKLNFNVIGFFEKDTNVVRNNNIINLDRYVCIPAFTELNYNKYPILSVYALAQQANGQILTLDSEINIVKIIEQNSLKYGTYKFEVYSDDKNETRNFIHLSDHVLNRIRIMNNVLILFTIISITISILGRIQKDYYRFGVQLLCGASIYNILGQIMVELFFVLSISVLLSLIISFIILGFGLYQLLLILIGFIIFISSISIPAYVLIKRQTNQLIRREE